MQTEGDWEMSFFVLRRKLPDRLVSHVRRKEGAQTVFLPVDGNGEVRFIPTPFRVGGISGRFAPLN